MCFRQNELPVDLTRIASFGAWVFGQGHRVHPRVSIVHAEVWRSEDKRPVASNERWLKPAVVCSALSPGQATM